MRFWGKPAAQGANLRDENGTSGAQYVANVVGNRGSANVGLLTGAPPDILGGVPAGRIDPSAMDDGYDPLAAAKPGAARSIALRVDPADLPQLTSPYDQPVKITVQSR